jgi:hypothetical protein
LPLYRKRSGVEIQWFPSAKQFRVVSDMEDGQHNMRLTMVVDQASLRIREINAEMPGVPDPICRRATDLLAGLLGKIAGPGIMRELGEDWVRAGCVHVKDVFRAACYSLPQAQAARAREDLNRLFPGLTEEQLYKIFFLLQPQLEESCVRYSDGSPFLQQVRSTALPEGAEKLRAAVPRQKVPGSAESAKA